MDGIWAPISKIDGQVTSKPEGFKSKGGEFVVPSFKSFIDFNACDGIVEIIMHAKPDFHATLPSNKKIGFSRLGTSIQCLVQRIKNLLLEKAKGKTVDGKVRGVKEIVAQKLQNFK